MYENITYGKCVDLFGGLRVRAAKGERGRSKEALVDFAETNAAFAENHFRSIKLTFLTQIKHSG